MRFFVFELLYSHFLPETRCVPEYTGMNEKLRDCLRKVILKICDILFWPCVIR